MALGTFSKFYYGYEITTTNYKLDFEESPGFTELTVEMPLGIYAPEDLAFELRTQLDAVGTKSYTVTFDRSNRKFTITADSGTINLLVSTGTNAAVSFYEVLGFTGSDLTGSATYTSNNSSGSVYKPQFWLQDYVAPSDWLEKSDASVNISANGKIEVVSFGDVNFTEFNILFITDLVMDGKVIKNNPNGVADANDFLTFCIKRGPIDFMPDEDDPNNFYTLVLENTSANSKGTGYKLTEETGKNLPGVFRSGKIKWRVQV
jgi:hypothetical protein